MSEFNKEPTIAELLLIIADLQHRIEQLEFKNRKESHVVTEYAPSYVQKYIAKTKGKGE
jgi:hypothetical protein